MDWCYEEFDIGKGILSSSHGLEIVQFERSSTMICQSAVTGKQRYKHVEEALVLLSGIKKYGSSLINIVSPKFVPTKSISQCSGPTGSTILERWSPNVMNESQIMNLATTHPLYPALVPFL
ncbi:hypothetical protein H5410_036232, partial [Solanum commersonii]